MTPQAHRLHTPTTPALAAARRPRRSRLDLAVLSWVVAIASTGCGSDAAQPPVDEARHPLGAAEANAASCVDACGGQSALACWCDPSCAEVGDCCSDYAAACVPPAKSDAQVLCEATGGGWETDLCECQQDANTTALDYRFDAELGCVPGDPPAKSDAQVLCEATGGGWETDLCECQQDANTTALDYRFDAELGCVPGDPPPPDDATLCQDSGGVWEDGACACAQDGASVHFVFQAEVGCAFPDDAPLRQILLSGSAADFLTQNAPAAGDGLYLIDRPGVADVVTFYADPADALAYLSGFHWVETFTATGACTGDLQTEALPTVNCEDGSISSTGCHFLTVDGFPRLGDQMTLLNEYGFADYTETEIANAATAGEGVLKVFVDGRHRATFAFAFKAGAWRLVFIDLSRYSCSA